MLTQNQYLAGFDRNPVSRRLLIITVVFLLFEPHLLTADTYDRASCYDLPNDGWNGSEDWIWKQICDRKEANFFDRDGQNLDPSKAKIWEATNDSRLVTSKFLQTILFTKPYRDHIPYYGVSIYGAHFPDSVDLGYGHLPWPLRILNSRFDEHLYLNWVRADGHISLRGSYIGGTVNLDDARISGGLMIGSAAPFPTLFSRVSLERTHIGLQLDVTITGAQELDGLVYSAIPRLKDPGDTETDRFDSQQEIDTYKRWLLTDDTFSPQPYRQLASVLRDAGVVDVAEDVLYEGYQRERSSASDWKRRLWLLAQWPVGYGVGLRIFRVLFFFLGFLVLGWIWIVAVQCRKGSLSWTIGRLGFWFSLDHLLPVIRLRDAHFDQVYLPRCTRWYFFFHQVMGYFLAFFLISGLANIPARI